MTKYPSGSRPRLVAVLAIVMIVSIAPLTVAQATVGTVAVTEDAGFPLLGWLSFVAVAGLGLMTAGLWVQFIRGSRST